MDDSRQERLSVENPGRISPPEPGLYLGTCGWSYADWEGTLYPEGLPAASRLAEYAKYYATVEIDSTFYGTPRRSTVEKWREVVPEGFLFAYANNHYQNHSPSTLEQFVEIRRSR